MQSLWLFAVHTSPEALSNLEDGQVLWLDLDGLVGLWVPSRVATVVTDSETAEAPRSSIRSPRTNASRMESNIRLTTSSAVLLGRFRSAANKSTSSDFVTGHYLLAVRPVIYSL